MHLVCLLWSYPPCTHTHIPRIGRLFPSFLLFFNILSMQGSTFLFEPPCSHGYFLLLLFSRELVFLKKKSPVNPAALKTSTWHVCVLGFLLWWSKVWCSSPGGKECCLVIGLSLESSGEFCKSSRNVEKDGCALLLRYLILMNHLWFQDGFIAEILGHAWEAVTEHQRWGAGGA